MRQSFEFRGPMTPEGAPPIAMRHLCYGSLFGGGGVSVPPTPAPPVPPAPVAMPAADPETQRRNELKKRAASRARTTTRASTMLGDDDTLGGG